MSFISVVAVMIELVGSFEGFEGLNASKARVLNWFRANVINESVEVRDRGACIKERGLMALIEVVACWWL